MGYLIIGDPCFKRYNSGMKSNDSCQIDANSGQKSMGDITDKKGFGARWLFSVRHVDNLLRAGLPHCKVGKRRVRILVDEGDAWMKERFGTRRAPARITSQ
jgi:hypothetical protein